MISTALLNDRGYHFFPVDTWKEIKLLLPGFKYQHFEALLIQIALPRIYRHKPLYYVPLYHELGHFIDAKFNITETTFLLDPLPPQSTPQDTQFYKYVYTQHRKEYFADLFAACYLGHENYKFLNNISTISYDTETHPATDKRIQVSQNFIANKNDPVVDLFQDALKLLGLPKLEKKYSRPNLSKAYDNLRPYNLNSAQETHGIFESAWQYFEDAIGKNDEPWSKIKEQDISRIINDLTEKSIRNRVIIDKWNYAASK